jgi:hypothetical protein
VVIEKVATEIGIGIASGMAQEGIKLAAKRMFRQNVDSKNPILYFGLWCEFGDMPLYDNARDTLMEVLGNLEKNGMHVVHSKNTFDYDISWKTIEACETPEEPWEYDAIMNEEEKELGDMPSECVLGFAFWLWPISQGDRKDMIISAYHLLTYIKQVQEKIPVMKSNSFAFIRANNETCLKIHSRLNKKMNENKETKGFLGTVDLQPLSKSMTLLTVPLHELVTAQALSDSFSWWGSIRK